MRGQNSTEESGLDMVDVSLEELETEELRTVASDVLRWIARVHRQWSSRQRMREWDNGKP